MHKIAVVGPESTGKSVLTQALATHYEAPFVAEYAREYIENLHREYTHEDVCEIAKKQIETEIFFAANNQAPCVFFDTDLIITKVWFEYCFGVTPEFVTQQIKTGFFDLYLLCEPDLPWEPDPVREHGSDREFFFDWYRREIEHLQKPFVLINGIGDTRISNAILQIDAFFKLNNQ